MLIIGAGPVGLAQGKALKENKIPYDHVEADDRVGGNWRHGVYDSAHILSSRKTTEYSDFPMPADYPDFPSRRQMLEYLESYADHFDLRGQIRFNTKVTYARPAEENKWEPSKANPPLEPLTEKGPRPVPLQVY
jgi:cation diffusion facilitator CzcD-associated flavoprotein CzcO